MEEIKKVIESPHSVKFGINAKGNFSAEVKAYGATVEEALERATKLAKEVEVIVKKKNEV